MTVEVAGKSAAPAEESLVDLERELQGMLREREGDGLRVCEVKPTDGHAGLSYFFHVLDRAAGTSEEFVLRLPPRGVRRQGNTDVYQQVPLLKALYRAGLPVPEVRWADAGETWFGRPFLVMRRLPGRVLFLFDPDPSFERSAPVIGSLWRQTVQWLADFHAFDWKRELPDWQLPRRLEDEIRRWQRIYVQAPEPAWMAAASAVEAALLRSLPSGEPVGLVHGDYQPGNLLFDQGQAVAVIDWELAGIGAQGLDLGWLMMSADPAMWAEPERPRFVPSPEEVERLYVARRGRAIERVAWYQALAGFRLASIACLNVKLHRKGQRHDPIWERFADSVMPMLERALQLLSQS